MALLKTRTLRVTICCGSSLDGIVEEIARYFDWFFASFTSREYVLFPDLMILLKS
jgi:hypothetical protein